MLLWEFGVYGDPNIKSTVHELVSTLSQQSQHVVWKCKIVHKLAADMRRRTRFVRQRSVSNFLQIRRN